MDRMLRKKKDNSDYEIDRELTWKFAIEKNAEYQDRIAELEEENKKLKDEKEFFYKSAKQFREDAESWRKEAELLLGIKICWKTLSERIEDDKKVVRIDTSCMEEDTLQELRDLGKI